MKQFKVQLSRPLLWVTVIVTLVLVGVFSFLLSLVVHPPFGLDNWIWLIVMGSLLIILVRFACMQPVLLELTDDRLTIVRVYGKVDISRHEIVEVYRKKRLWLDMKIFGDAGWFGYIGVFWNKKEGLHRDYVKDLSKAVVIRTNHGYYIVSCEHPGDLIHELKKSMHVL